MYVKVMGPENVPDDDTRKTFRLLQQVVDVSFTRDKEEAILTAKLESGDVVKYAVPGNVYILNDQGKTIESFGVARVPRGRRN